MSSLAASEVLKTDNENFAKMMKATKSTETEDKLQRLQWIPKLSPWQSFRFCVWIVCIIPEV